MNHSRNQGFKLDATHIDVLREMGNIGMGNAVTSLAQLLNKKVNMEVPQAGFYPLDEIIESIGGYEELVSCVILRVQGDISGTIQFIFNRSSTFNLVDMMMGLERGSTSEMDDMGKSVVMEVGNVLSGSFATALGTMTNLKILTSVPVFAFDMLGAVFSASLAACGYVQERVLSIETVLFGEEESVKGHFLLLTEPPSLKRLFSALGIDLVDSKQEHT